jgi:carboxypeptidase C (cathepsin A)
MDSVVTGREIVTTKHTVTVDGAPLPYTARAGFIPLLDEATGEVHAKIFFVSYTVAPKRGSPARPLTFYTNGGPPEPATLAALGPRSPKGLEVERPPSPPSYQLVDNQKTWLTFTDLVLIDPVGTGYSRATKPEYAKQYYNVDGDAESIAQFIQRYLQRYDPAKQQPIFVAGWSHGSIRSVLIADIAKRYGFAPRGLILLASALGNQPRRGVNLVVSDLGYIQQLPTMTATAFFHKKLAPDLQRNFDEALGQAEAWAANEYPKLLAQTNHLSREQQQAAAAGMARLTGLSPEVILQNRFRMLPDAFLSDLFHSEWPVLALGDSRLLSVCPGTC